MTIRGLSVLLVILAMIQLVTVAHAHRLIEYREVRTLEMMAPAITSTGQGTLSRITLAVAYPGYGRVFFSALPYSEVETQGAARIAAYLSSLITNKSFSSYDYYVMMESTIPLIGGPSAGALITVGLTALLLNLEIRSNVTMTGMINPDGSIGKVGGLKEKIEAAAQAGFKVFLIPAGQRIYRFSVIEEQHIGPFIIRRVTEREIDLYMYGESLGIRVIEVSNIKKALEYFIGIDVGRESHVSGQESYELPRKLSAFINEVRDKVNTTIMNTQSLLNDLRSPLIQGLYESRLISLRRSIEYILSQANENPAYATRMLINIYRDAISLYFMIGLSLNRISIHEIAEAVNKSLAEYLNSIQSMTSNGNCTLKSSLSSFLANLAKGYYSLLSESVNAEMIIRYASEALAYIQLGRLYQMLESKTMLNCSTSAYTEVISHTYAVYAYILRLLNEIGVQANTPLSVQQTLSIMSELYSKQDPGLYAGYIYTLAYSSHYLHTILGSRDVLINSRDEIIQIYDVNVTDELISYQKRLVEESIIFNDQGLALISLLELIGILQVLRLTIINSELMKHEDWLDTTISPTPLSTTHQSTPETSRDNDMRNYSTSLETLVLIVVVAGLIIIAVRFLKSIR